MAPQIPKIAEEHGVHIVGGPYVNREHTVVVIVETERVADLDAFLVAARLPQWNQIRILPSLTMEESMNELQTAETIF
jgi:hypothetical protein